MTDHMKPGSFASLLEELLGEYRVSKSFLQVPVTRNKDAVRKNQIGPAAGPHTQLAGNLVAAYAAGANYFELKTVQIMEGEALGIIKPCIYTATEVFNTEWSTELTVEDALAEYIKGYLLLKILIVELELGDPEDFTFVMSVGYDLAGIQSPKIDGFINQMKAARDSKEWQKDMEYLKSHLDSFTNIQETYLDSLSDQISDTMALSTMHGCKSHEIEAIANYLIREKELNVFVKMNPTLLGEEKVRETLDGLGYGHLHFDSHNFKSDIDYETACEMITRLLETGKSMGKEFGVKLTNTFPVRIEQKELSGDTMYLSGPALYGISIQVAALLAKRFQGRLPISYSGGADKNNIQEILATGIHPVTVSSILLKPAGYGNLRLLSQQAEQVEVPEHIDWILLESLSQKASKDQKYGYTPKKTFTRAQDYSVLCGACHNCVDVCPNRANRCLQLNNQKVVIHLDDYCNECGACSCYCIKGRDPYREKFTFFSSKESFEASGNPGAYREFPTWIRRFEKSDQEEILTSLTKLWEEHTT